MSYDVDFSDVAVDHDALLGMPDDYFAEPWFSAGCIRFGAVQLGGALGTLRVVHTHLRAAGRHRDAYQRERFARMEWRWGEDDYGWKEQASRWMTPVPMATPMVSSIWQTCVATPCRMLIPEQVGH